MGEIVSNKELNTTPLKILPKSYESFVKVLH